METEVILILMVGCLLMEGFFSGSEIGVVSADRLKLRHQAAKGSKGAALALQMLEKPEWLLSTTLVGTNIAIVTNTSLGTLLSVQLWGPDKAWVAILFLAPMIWIFGEIVPKSVFQQQSDVITPRIIFVLKGASYLFWPILVVFSMVVRLLARLVGSHGEESPFTLREEIIMSLQLPDAEGDIQQGERSMIRRVFQFSEARVRDIMVPLVEVDAIDRAVTCAQAVALAGSHHHPRLPVFAGRVDNIIGQIDAIDLLGKQEGKPIDPFVQPVRYVPGVQKLEVLLRSFRDHKDHLAVVVGEYGGCQGIVTLVDTLEQAVGEIQGEFEEEGSGVGVPWVQRLGEQDFLASGRIDLTSLQEKTGIELPEGGYETLAGFLLEHLELLPEEGQEYVCDPYTLTVKGISQRMIREVRIQW